LPRGPTLSGIIAPPVRLTQRQPEADGAGFFFTVFTLQSGPEADIEFNGSGPGTVVSVGQRVVKFDGSTILLE
jgi:hypothetical protein